MDAVRQWWFDTAWPFVTKLRWFAAAWVVLALVAIPWSIRAQERSLENASRAALADSGIVVDDVSFSGRNGVVTGSLTVAQQSEAAAALAGVEGIRALDWQTVAPPVAAPVVTTTTSTTIPAGESAILELKVQSGRIVVRGVLPDAESAAAVGAVAELLYGPSIGNGLTVGDVWAPEWFAVAPDLVAVLPIAGDVSVVLDVEGVRITANASSQDVERSLRNAVSAAVGNVVAVEFDVAIAEGSTPTVEIADVGDGTVTMAGSVGRRKLADEIGAAATAVSDGVEVLNEIAVDKNLAEVHVIARFPQLIARMGSAEQWALRYDGADLNGLVAGEGIFRGRQSDPTLRMENLIDELAALLLGNPSLTIEVEISTEVADAPEANVELARRRGFSVLNLLIRAGVDPERISTTVGDDEGEVLRFRLAVADR